MRTPTGLVAFKLRESQNIVSFYESIREYRAMHSSFVANRRDSRIKDGVRSEREKDILQKKRELRNQMVESASNLLVDYQRFTVRELRNELRWVMVRESNLWS